MLLSSILSSFLPANSNPQEFRVRIIRAGSDEYAEIVLNAAAKAVETSAAVIAPPPSMGRVRSMFQWNSKPEPVKADDITTDLEIAKAPDEKPNSFTEALAESHYTLLEIPTDFDGSNEGGDLLRRAFRQTSRRLHPDKPRGSEEMFQLAAAAHAVLLDAAERERYDKGYDMPHREEGIDHYAGGYGQASGKNGQLNQGNGFSIHHGSTLHWAWPRFQGFSLEDEIQRHYYPERHGLRLFGDPLENKRRHEERTTKR